MRARLAAGGAIVVAAVAMAVGGAVACSLSLEGYSGEADARAEGDGAAGDAEGGGAEGGAVEGGAGEGGEAGPSAEAGASFCAGLTEPADFCADFDESGDAGVGWEDQSHDPGASLTVDGAFANSPPQAAHFVTDGQSAAELIKEVSGATTGFHVELSVRVETYGTAGLLELVSIHQKVGGTTQQVNVYLGNDRVRIQDDPTIAFKELPVIPTKTWKRIVLDVTIGPPSSVTAMIDGKSVTQPLATRDTGIFSTHVGAPYLYQTNDTWDFSVDDIVLRKE